eukprot:1193449-Prorocentrum_minimum.AAC.2
MTLSSTKHTDPPPPVVFIRSRHRSRVRETPVFFGQYRGGELDPPRRSRFVQHMTFYHIWLFARHNSILHRPVNRVVVRFVVPLPYCHLGPPLASVRLAPLCPSQPPPSTVRTTALNIHTKALNIHTIALNLHITALNIHTIAPLNLPCLPSSQPPLFTVRPHTAGVRAGWARRPGGGSLRGDAKGGAGCYGGDIHYHDLRGRHPPGGVEGRPPPLPRDARAR